MDGVESKEEVKTTNTETEKDNLWTRIKNIFKQKKARIKQAFCSIIKLRKNTNP